MVVPTSSIARPSKIYPNWDFWFENIPSGNPGSLRAISDFSFSLPVLAKKLCRFHFVLAYLKHHYLHQDNHLTSPYHHAHVLFKGVYVVSAFEFFEPIFVLEFLNFACSFLRLRFKFFSQYAN
jgi:hypothetical protein